MHGLRRGDRGIGIAHRRRDDGAGLDHELGLHAEKGRVPDHEIGELADFHRANMRVHAVRDGGVDGVFGDVALDPEVIRPGADILGERAALGLHLVGGLPGAGDHLADAGPWPGCRRP